MFLYLWTVLCVSNWKQNIFRAVHYPLESMSSKAKSNLFAMICFLICGCIVRPFPCVKLRVQVRLRLVKQMKLGVTIGSHEESYASDLMTKRYLQFVALLQFCTIYVSHECSLVDMALWPYVFTVWVSPCRSVSLHCTM